MDLEEYKSHLINNVYKSECKKQGFVIDKNTFRKKENGFVKIIDFELSHFNTKLQFSYNIRIGIFFPEAYNFRITDFYGDEEFEIPTKPKIQDCQFHATHCDIIGTTSSYTVNLSTEQHEFERIAKDEIKEIMSIFDKKITDIDTCIQFIKEKTDSNLCIIWGATAYLALGQIEISKKIIEEYLNNESEQKKIKRISNFFSKRGIDLNQKFQNNNIINSIKGEYP